MIFCKLSNGPPQLLDSCLFFFRERRTGKGKRKSSDVVKKRASVESCGMMMIIPHQCLLSAKP